MRRSLVEAIRFRWLFARLSRREYLLFLDKMFDRCGSEWIGSLSFKRLNQQQQRYANQTLCSIIQSRESDATSDASEHVHALDALPQTLLGHAASFLDQRDYLWMERASRVVFLSLNSPNKLVKMDLSDVSIQRGFWGTTMNRFGSLESLAIHIRYFLGFSLSSSSANLQKLKEMELHAHGAFEFTDQGELMSKMDGIRKLKLFQFGWQFDTNSLCWLLNPFENVEDLEMTNVSLLVPIDEKVLQSLLPNVQRLSIRAKEDGYGRNSHFVHHLAGSLRYLHLDYSARTTACNRQHFEVEFPNLKHLRLDAVNLSGPIYQFITQNAPNLISFRINPYVNAEPLSSDDQEAWSILGPLFKTMTRLQHFTVDVRHDDWERVFVAIEDGLFGTFKTQRDSLCVRITILSTSAQQPIDSKEVIKNICKFMHWQHGSETKSSVLLLDIGECHLTNYGRGCSGYECTLADLNKLFPTVGAFQDGSLFFAVRVNVDPQDINWIS